jgi:hypothetical protein
VTRSWWRRNSAALIALAVLVPATVTAIGWREWSATYEVSSQYVRPVVVAEGEDTIEFAGATWGPVTSGTFTADDGLPVPEGAEVIAVKIPVRNNDPDDLIGCPSPVLVEQSTGRQWSEMSIALDLDYDPDAPTLCSTDSAAPYEMLVPFIVPEDAVGPFWIDVMPYGEGPGFVRFSIDP